MNCALRTRAGPYLTNLRKVTFMSVRRVALLTAGGFAPCLSSAVGGLIERYNEIDPTVEIIAYQNGYHGLLTGNYVLVDEEARKHAAVLHRFGGSPIGNSRVKLTNKKNLVERGLVAEDEDPLQKAAEQLRETLAAAAGAPPSTGELIASSGLDSSLVHRALGSLEKQGLVRRIGADFYFDVSALAAFEQAVRARLVDGPATAAELKDAMCTSRKYAIPLLEYFDSQAVTRREGDTRVREEDDAPREVLSGNTKSAPIGALAFLAEMCANRTHPRRSARLTAALKAVEPTRTHPSPIRRCRFGTVDMIAHLSATRTRVPKCCVSFSNSPKVRRSGGDAPHPPAHGARTRGLEAGRASDGTGRSA